MTKHKKRFIVEIEVPEGFDGVWDEDTTGLCAFNDCIVVCLPAESLNALVRAKDEPEAYQDFVNRKNDVRASFRVIKPVEIEE